MNKVIQILNNNYFKWIVIIILICIITWLSIDHFSDVDDTFDSIPPHVEQLPLRQPIKEQPPVADQTPTQSNRFKSPPNYNNKQEMTTNENANTRPGNIYRIKTGRDAYEQEQFVSIYDANFGGMLGTNMGL